MSQMTLPAFGRSRSMWVTGFRPVVPIIGRGIDVVAAIPGAPDACLPAGFPVPNRASPRTPMTTQSRTFERFVRARRSARTCGAFRPVDRPGRRSGRLSSSLRPDRDAAVRQIKGHGRAGRDAADLHAPSPPRSRTSRDSYGCVQRPARAIPMDRGAPHRYELASRPSRARPMPGVPVPVSTPDEAIASTWQQSLRHRVGSAVRGAGIVRQRDENLTSGCLPRQGRRRTGTSINVI